MKKNKKKLEEIFYANASREEILAYEKKKLDKRLDRLESTPEKVIIRETPINTEVVKEVALHQTGEEIVSKINELELTSPKQIDFLHIKNFPWHEIRGLVKNSNNLISWGGTTLQTGGVNNSSQTLLNLTAGSGISITDSGSGVITLASTVVSPVDGGGVANEIAYWVDGNTVGNLAVATYPSLTELSYVKGLTSSVQTQLNAKMTNPMTTGGDIIYGGVAGLPTRLANGTVGLTLHSNGTTLAPTWATIDLTDGNQISGALGQSNGGSGTSSTWGAGVLTWILSATAANLRSAVSGTTGTAGSLVFSGSPTLTTPDIGAAVATSINIGASGVVSALFAGTYTPTDSAHTNLTGSDVTMTEAQYMRVGNTVTVSGRFTGTATLTATATSFEITLPVASNIGAAEDVAGIAFCGTIAGMGAEVIGVVANDTAKIQWTSSDISSRSWSYQFSYQII